jgi:hypothetical protein
VSVTAGVCIALASTATARAQEPDAPPLTERPPLAALPPKPSYVRVHLDGSNGVEVARDTPLGWTTVCAGVCDQLLPADGSYRISGSMILSSAPFTLRAPNGQTETLQVHAASDSLFVLGMIGVIGGGATMYLTWPVGAVFGFCLLGEALAPSPGQDCLANNGNSQGMLVAFLIGGAAALVGTALVATNFKTTVDHLFPGLSPQPAAASAPHPPPPPLAWVLPAPAWKERAGQDGSPLVDVPIVHGRF